MATQSCDHMQHILYTRSGVAREHHLRRDLDELSTLIKADQVLTVPVWRDLSLVRDDDPHQPWLDKDRAKQLLLQFPQTIFLGKALERPVFAVDVSALEGGESGPDLCPGTHFVNLRQQGPQMPAEAGALLAYARGLVFWHRVHQHCSVCGAPTQQQEAGHVRRCTRVDCGHLTYPRTDPAVIMLVENEDKILLHRQQAWPQGMWSCLAGFVEPGETLEDAVRREVMEESGIVADHVQYVASQPWPFPSSLMIAFTAKAVGGSLSPDLSEIEDARWFSDQDLVGFDDANRHSGQGRFLAVPGSVARHLIEMWKARKR